MFLFKQIQDAFRIDVGSRQDEPRAGHDTGEGDSPGIGVEHRSDRQNAVVVADGKGIRHRFRERVQHQRAMRIDHPFRRSCGAGSEAHYRAVVFIQIGISKIVTSLGEQLLVI